MFATDENLQILKSCKLWMADGTFKSVPAIWRQLYTIHGYVTQQNTSIPLIYMLLPDKKKRTYTRALEIIQQSVDGRKPDNIVCDFEGAFIGACHSIYPDTNIKGCYFHFRQCVYRHIQQCGLQTLYAENLEFSSAMKMLAGLAYVPVDDVVQAYEELLDTVYFVDNEELLEDFLDYFETTWIGKKRRHSHRGEPTFAIKLWNNYDYIKNDLPRTNNFVEGWNSSFNKRIGKYIEIHSNNF